MVLPSCKESLVVLNENKDKKKVSEIFVKGEKVRFVINVKMLISLIDDDILDINNNPYQRVNETWDKKKQNAWLDKVINNGYMSDLNASVSTVNFDKVGWLNTPGDGLQRVRALYYGVKVLYAQDKELLKKLLSCQVGINYEGKVKEEDFAEGMLSLSTQGVPMKVGDKLLIKAGGEKSPLIQSVMELYERHKGDVFINFHKNAEGKCKARNEIRFILQLLSFARTGLHPNADQGASHLIGDFADKDIREHDFYKKVDKAMQFLTDNQIPLRKSDNLLWKQRDNLYTLITAIIKDEVNDVLQDLMFHQIFSAQIQHLSKAKKVKYHTIRSTHVRLILGSYIEAKKSTTHQRVQRTGRTDHLIAAAKLYKEDPQVFIDWYRDHEGYGM